MAWRNPAPVRPCTCITSRKRAFALFADGSDIRWLAASRNSRTPATSSSGLPAPDTGGGTPATTSCHDRLVQPTGQHRVLLNTLFASTKANGGARPALFDAAFLTMRYRTEFALLELPAVVRHVVIPFVYVLGTLLGKYKKFKDAPPPRTI